MKESEQNQSLAYQRDVLEFATVAVQFCAYMEEAEQHTRREFVDTLLKLLPLLYIKGMLLTPFDTNDDVELQDAVSEENYDIVRSNVAFVMGNRDDYLDVFVEDMRYSDTPILMTVSENLADMYQDVKNFCVAFRSEVEECMLEAVAQCRQNFEHYWGQKLVNVMRALHEVRFGETDDEEG
ncbi:MAG: DUF5063 domain-containing protein [Prevotellaceae bacterium]|nr:DUF5063 domain-containing protein [Prevotellaceae bacterium]